MLIKLSKSLSYYTSSFCPAPPKPPKNPKTKTKPRSNFGDYFFHGK